MVRNFKRKTERGLTPPDLLMTAVRFVHANNVSLRKTSKIFNISLKTLARYFKLITPAEVNDPNRTVPNVHVGFVKARQIFTEAEENELVQTVLQAPGVNNAKDVRLLAYQFATAKSKKMPSSWVENHMAGADWFYAFIRRHPEIPIRSQQRNSAPTDETDNKISAKKKSAAVSSPKDVVVTLHPSSKKAGAKTEDITSCVSESLSSEDSNHSELLHSGDPLALEDDSRPGTSSSVDFASFPGTSGVNPLPSSSFATVEMPPPRLPPSRGASPALQSMSVTQSLPLPAQNRGGERETSSEERVTPGSVGNGLNDALLETNRLDDALQRLEGISDKVNGLSGAEDNFDNFGKYVASLLRGLPTSKVADVQQQVINLILSSHISPDAPSGDLNSSSSAGIAPSCSTSETLPTPKPPPPPPPPQTHSPAQSTPTSALQSNSKSTSQPQQTKKGEKRPHAHDDSPSGVGNKQVKLEDTEQIDATLKRLEEISDRVNQLGGRDDSFDVFGKYAASILRCLPPQRAMELQKEVVNLILREQGDSMTQTARRFHAAATVAVS